MPASTASPPRATRTPTRSLQDWALENLVVNELAAQEAERLSLTVTDEELQTELEGYLAYYQAIKPRSRRIWLRPA